MEICKDIKYIGVNDHNIDLFEGQYPVPNGMSYNSYIIDDEKIAVLDTVDERFTDLWFNNLKTALNGRTPDYLIVHHMEPDHSANILKFANEYPQTVIVSSSKAFDIMKNFFGTDFSDRRICVSDGSTLSLGKHSLSFITAPMVHWPEVIVSYENLNQILFSADAFGKFGALDREEDWACEARRYYIGIVGKYGVQVQNLFKKTATLDIKTICPLHGPTLNNNIPYYLELYNTWSSYKPEEEGIVIAYTSVYGNTKKAALKLAELLKLKGEEKVVIYDLARSDMTEAVEDAFKYSKLVLATTTYNASIFPFMKEFINHLTERNFQNRQIALIENGSWAPIAAKTMRSMFEQSKNVSFTKQSVKINSALNSESEAQLEALADELCGIAGDCNSQEESQITYTCNICGYVYQGDALPDDFVCPICRRTAKDFTKNA